MKYNLFLKTVLFVFKLINGVICPAKSTVSYTFEFNANDIPVGNNGFTAEMVCGDYVFKRTLV